MTTIEDTDDLIRSLAADAQTRRRTLRPSLAAAAAAGTILAVTASLALLASGTGLADAIHHRWLYQKLLCMAAIAAAAWLLVEDLAAPERRPLRNGALLAALTVLVAGGVVDPGGTAYAGRAPWSAPACMAAIILLSLPILALVLAALRGAAAPTRPAMAGAAAGLLAGALGAIAYAFSCRNDGGLFVLIWYGSALAIVGALGAAAGVRTLAW